MREILTNIFTDAIEAVFGEAGKDCDPLIQVASRAEYGDYQANFAMRLAKKIHKKPFEIANAIVTHLANNSIFKTLEPSGPGFINIFLANDFLSSQLQNIIHDERLNIHPADKKLTVVVDYANANVAKEMHVGHIRSIVIGDAIVRILSFLGNNIIRQSHLGDWGTQFGMLIEYLIETGKENDFISVSDLDSIYKKSKERFDTDSLFADRARARVVALQSGDKNTFTIWKKLVKESLSYFQVIYDQLDVLLTEEDARGESFYNAMLSEIISECEKKGIVHTSDGAKVVFMEEFPIPFMVQKKDGGYLYSTTDLAAAKYRIEKLHADWIIYLTDARQKQHFSMLFSTLRQTGWLNNNVRLEHHPFGTILGSDNKPFKTRSGESIRLITLLEEAEKRARTLSREKNPTLSDEQLNHIAHVIGIGALKYADLRTEKIKDYVFDWDKLLSFEGNTAPYLQNAYVRIRSLFRKANIKMEDLPSSPIVLGTEVEHALAIKILSFSDIIYSVAEDLALHRLCDYLYDIAACFHRFYENCPILSGDNTTIKNSRLLMSALTARTLHLGLELLGIKTLEQM